jgi:septal ring factor EnvC (AmiA/AmiB activator)
MMKRINKPETSSKQKKQLETQTVDLENIFYETINEIAETLRRKPLVKRRTQKTRLRDQIIHAETWPERDQLLKSLAAKAYDVAHSFMEVDPDKALKWMRLVAKLLSLSFVPKRLDDLELIKKELATLKEQAREMEEEEGEDGEG